MTPFQSCKNPSHSLINHCAEFWHLIRLPGAYLIIFAVTGSAQATQAFASFKKKMQGCFQSNRTPSQRFRVYVVLL